MSRTTTQKIVSVALLAIVGSVLPFLAADAEAQRRFMPADGTECLVVTGTAPTEAPRVTGSREPFQEAYIENDVLYVGGPGVSSFTVGQQLQFVRPYGEIRHPDTGDVIAEAIGWLGFAEVVEVGAERATVRVTKSCREIEVGELLLEPDLRPVAMVDAVPDFEPIQLVTPSENDATIIFGELESVISESGTTRTGTAARDAYAQRDVVIIDQGSANGWSPGDVVDLYRAERLIETSTGATGFTPLMLGIGLIVAVADDAAAVLIVEGDLAVEIGDRVRLNSSGS